MLGAGRRCVVLFVKPPRDEGYCHPAFEACEDGNTSYVEEEYDAAPEGELFECWAAKPIYYFFHVLFMRFYRGTD